MSFRLKSICHHTKSDSSKMKNEAVKTVFEEWGGGEGVQIGLIGLKI